MNIIGISGKKKSGKDTVAALIKNSYKGYCMRAGFADTLKMQVSRATGQNLNFIEMHKDAFRPILQWWGTDYRRKFYGEDYWLKQMDKELDCAEANGINLVVIADVRFKNELDYVKKRGGITLRINRAGQPADSHPSEVELDNAQFDFVIENNGTLDELKTKINAILNK